MRPDAIDFEPPRSAYAAIVLAWLYSAFNIICSPIALVPFFDSRFADPALSGVLEEHRWYTWAMVGSSVLLVVASFAAIPAGIAALRGKAWGVRFLRAYAWTMLIAIVATVLASTPVIYMPLLEAGIIGNKSRQFAAVAGTGASVCCSGASIVVPLAMLFALSRETIDAAYPGLGDGE